LRLLVLVLVLGDRCREWFWVRLRFLAGRCAGDGVGGVVRRSSKLVWRLLWQLLIRVDGLMGLFELRSSAVDLFLGHCSSRWIRADVSDETCCAGCTRGATKRHNKRARLWNISLF